jgi:hypothetical protein
MVKGDEQLELKVKLKLISKVKTKKNCILLVQEILHPQIRRCWLYRAIHIIILMKTN